MYNRNYAIANHSQHSASNVRTPWGPAQSCSVVADGIVFVTTASHGGYLLSKERYDAMPSALQRMSFTGDQAFEEDCSWCAVVLAFPFLFPSDGIRKAAIDAARNMYSSADSTHCQYDDWCAVGCPTADGRTWRDVALSA